MRKRFTAAVLTANMIASALIIGQILMNSSPFCALYEEGSVFWYAFGCFW